jgi:hypothetical protein
MSLLQVIQTALSNLQQDPATAQLFTVVNAIGPAAILGPAVRQWYYSQVPTDINIVINCTADELAPFATYGGVKVNKDNVTGYQFTVSGVNYFVWNLTATWAIIQNDAFAEPVVAETIALGILPQTVFFNLDAVAYELDTQTIYDGGFFACIASKTLDIVYENHLQPLRVAAQAMMLLMQYQLMPSLALQAFIQEQIALGLDVVYFNTQQTATYGGVIYAYNDVIKLLG